MPDSANINTSKRPEFLVLAILTVLTLALFCPVSGYEFNNYDDAQYIVNNIHVKTGLSFQNIAWAFTSGYASNWHPLTWISHMIDCQIYGLRPGWHHMTNVIIHTLNVLLLFKLWFGMTGRLWRSAFVAALFAWHPVHVESVAFVAERKDVLSAFFGLATLLAYWRYSQAPDKRKFTYVVLGLGLGLLAKPMLVTLPVLMLLLDFWPLHRNESPARLIIEKIPLFILCAISSVLTIWAQKTGGAVASITALPIANRLTNVSTSYVDYIGKLFFPTKLSAFYPYVYHIPPARWISSAALMVGLSLLALAWARRRPHMPVGWFWFVISLLPVIGLIQVGNQSMADRYTYIPSIGLFVLITWEAADWIVARPALRPVFGGAAVTTLIACIAATAHQLPYWRDSHAIFTHALDVTTNNAFAECSLGVELLSENKTEEAIPYFRTALKLEPYFDRALANLGLAYLYEGKTDAAITNLQRTLELNAKNPYAHYGLAVALDSENKTEEAKAHYQEAVKIDPELPEAQASLGAILVSEHKPQEAEPHFAVALEANPNMPEAQFQYGNAYLLEGKLPEAEIHYREAARLNPQFAYADLNLAFVLERQGKIAEGIDAAKTALSLAIKSGDTNLASQLQTHLDSFNKKK